MPLIDLLRLHTLGPFRVEELTEADEHGFAVDDVNIETADGLTTICAVAAGLPASETNANAERIVACLNACEGIMTKALTRPDSASPHHYSFAGLRETLRTMCKQYRENDTEGLEESIDIIELNILMLDNAHG
jgi:hypothetical protein